MLLYPRMNYNSQAVYIPKFRIVDYEYHIPICDVYVLQMIDQLLAGTTYFTKLCPQVTSCFCKIPQLIYDCSNYIPYLT